VKVTVSIPDSISRKADRLGTNREETTAIHSGGRTTLVKTLSLVLAVYKLTFALPEEVITPEEGRELPAASN
jgi:hypothetical protein